MKPRRSIRLEHSAKILAGSIAALLASQSAQAAAITWQNTVGTDFNAGASWVGGTAPGVGDNATFTGVKVTNPNLSASLTIQGLTFSSTTTSGYDLTSTDNTIKLTLTNIGTAGTSAINAVNTSGTNIIDAPLVLGAAAAATQTITQASGGTLTLNGVLSSTNTLNATNGLTYTGASATAIFNINGANTYLGGTTLGAGTFNLGNAAAFSGGAVALNGVTVSASTDLSGNTNKLANAFSLGGTNIFQGSQNIELGGLVTETGTRTLTNNLTSGKTLTLSGGLALSSSASNFTLSIGGSGATLINSTISNGSGGSAASLLTYNGTGTLTLGGGASNTYGGLTTVSSGSVSLAKTTGAFQAIANGGLTVGGANNTAATVQYTGASSDMMGTGTVTINGRGILDFNGATDTIGNVAIVATGATTTNTTPIINTAGNGNLTIGTLAITPVVGFTSVVNSSTGTLTLGGNVTFTAATTGQAQISGKLALGAAQRTFTVGLGTGATQDLLVDAVVSDSGFGFIKAGTGRMNLAGNNTYTGSTTINAGTLIFSGASALPSGSAITMAGTTLQIANDGAGNNGTISLGNSITSNGAVTATIAVGNNGSANTGNTVAFGALSNGTAAQANSTTFTFTGANGYLQSFTSLALAGAGGGGTTLNPTSTSVTISGNVTNQETTTGAGHFDTLILDGTSSGNAINGVISDSPIYGGVGQADTRITKQNTSTWTLGGANTYHGPTVINNGTLKLGATNSIPTASALTVSGTGASVTGILDLAGFNETTNSLTLGGSTATSGATVTNSTGSSTLKLSGGATALTYSATNNPLGATISTTTVDLNGAAQTFTVGDSTTAANDLSISSIIQNGSFTKAGAGTLVLSGANTYNGGTTVSAGFLEFVNTAAQPATGTVTVAAGAGLILGVGGAGFYSGANVNQYFTNTLANVNTSSGSLGIDTTAGDFNLGGLTLPTNSAVSINKLGANALNLGAITRQAASTVNFTITTGTLTTTTLNTGISILGGYATFGGSTWAVSAGDGTNPGAISGLAAGSYTASVAGTTAPGSTADVDFQATNTTAYTGQTINSLRFNTASTTLNLLGNNIITTGGILVTSVASGSSISGGTLEGSASSDLIVINNNSLSIGSTIANNGGATGLTKSGSGALTLTAGNTYSGATVINAGSLSLSSGAALSNTSSIVLGAGTTLSLARNSTQSSILGSGVISGAGGIIENINNPNQAPSLDRANTYTGPTLLNIRGGFTAGVVSTYDVNGNQTSGAFGVNSAIQMTVGGPILFLAGRNNQVGSLSGSSGNVYLGSSAGNAAAILTTGGDNTSTSFGVTISDTYLGNNSSGSGAVSIGGQVVKIGTGTQTFTANNLYGGATTITGGTLSIATIANGGAQTTGSTSGSSTTLTVASTAGIVVGQTVLGAGIQNASTTVTAIGVGSVTLSTAVTVPASSGLSFGNGNGIGTSSNAASNLVLDGGTLQYLGTTVGSTDRLFQIGRSTDTGAATGTIDSSSVSSTNSLSFTNTGAITYGKVDQADNLTLTGSNIGANTLAPSIGDNGTGAVSVTKTGSGIWSLTGTGNAYSGGTTVSAGTLTSTVAGGFGAGNVTVTPTGTTLAGSAILNTTGSIASTALVTVNNNSLAIGTVNFNGTAPTIGGLSGTGSVVLNNASGTALTVGSTNNLTSIFGGVISNGAGTGSLVKAGTGTLTLSNTNTYTGTTTVSAGKLLVTGSTATSSAVSVSAGTVTDTPVATLGGTGTVGGNVSLAAESSGTFKNGGVLAPTAGLDGTKLSVTGTTTFNTGSLFEWDMSATTPGTDPGVVSNSGSYGQLAGNGAITGSGAVFQIVLGSGNAFTDAFWDTAKTWNNVFSGSGATTNLVDIFSTFSGGGVVNSDGSVTGQGQFTFTGPTTLNWSAVPEPTSALAGLLLSRRSPASPPHGLIVSEDQRSSSDSPGSPIEVGGPGFFTRGRGCEDRWETGGARQFGQFHFNCSNSDSMDRMNTDEEPDGKIGNRESSDSPKDPAKNHHGAELVRSPLDCGSVLPL